MMESTGALRAGVLDTRRRTRQIHLTVPAGDPGVRTTIYDDVIARLANLGMSTGQKGLCQEL